MNRRTPSSSNRGRPGIRSGAEDPGVLARPKPVPSRWARSPNRCSTKPMITHTALSSRAVTTHTRKGHPKRVAPFRRATPPCAMSTHAGPRKRHKQRRVGNDGRTAGSVDGSRRNALITHQAIAYCERAIAIAEPRGEVVYRSYSLWTMVLAMWQQNAPLRAAEVLAARDADGQWELRATQPPASRTAVSTCSARSRCASSSATTSSVARRRTASRIFSCASTVVARSSGEL
jgi:hypothetical protein